MGDLVGVNAVNGRVKILRVEVGGPVGRAVEQALVSVAGPGSSLAQSLSWVASSVVVGERPLGKVRVALRIGLWLDNLK